MNDLYMMTGPSLIELYATILGGVFFIINILIIIFATEKIKKYKIMSIIAILSLILIIFSRVIWAPIVHYEYLRKMSKILCIINAVIQIIIFIVLIISIVNNKKKEEP